MVFDIERNAALPRIDRAVRSAGGVKRKGHSRSVPGADRPAKDHCDPSCRFAIIGSGRICVSMNVQVRTIKDQVTVIPPAVYIQIHGMSTGEGKRFIKSLCDLAVRQQLNGISVIGRRNGLVQCFIRSFSDFRRGAVRQSRGGQQGKKHDACQQAR